jgi:hypothetical protein
MSDVLTPEPYPDSQYLELNPILTAIFSDIATRNIKDYGPSMTVVSPVDPGAAYALSIYDRFAHMTLHRVDPAGGQLEVWFGTGGRQYGPVRWHGSVIVQSDLTALLSLMATQWITQQLDVMDLTAWSLAKFNKYFPDVVGNAQYTDVLRVFARDVLHIPEFSFETGVDVRTDDSQSAA